MTKPPGPNPHANPPPNQGLNPSTGVGSAAFTHEQGDRIPGYRKLTDASLDAITELKQGEERALRYLDGLANNASLDMRWLSLARTHLQFSTMFAIRAIAQPTRIPLPGDHPPRPQP